MIKQLPAIARNALAYTRLPATAGYDVLVEIHDPKTYRTIRQLIILAQLSDYNVLLRMFPTVDYVRVYERMHYHPNVRVVWWRPQETKNVYLITDKEPDAETIKRFAGVLVIRFVLDPAESTDDDGPIAPFLMHPQIYVEHKELPNLPGYRQAERKVRILFSGNINEVAYDNPAILERFGVQNRYQVMDYLRQNGRLVEVTTQKAFDAIEDGVYDNQFVFIDTQKFRVRQRDWFKLLSSAEFFVATPGTRAILCHNIVEAMATGTIPITNYPAFFVPSLADGKSALTFSSFEELDEVMDRALAMTDKELDAMRQGAIAYYERYQKPEGYLRQILETEPPLKRMRIIPNV